MTTEIHSHLSDKHLCSVVCMLPGSNLGTAWVQLLWLVNQDNAFARLIIPFARSEKIRT